MIHEPYNELGLEASHQWGLFTAAQAERLGVSFDRLSGLILDPPTIVGSSGCGNEKSAL